MKNNKWLYTNEAYWNSLAGKYNFLYNDAWSIKENEYVTNKLQQIIIQGKTKALDIGCGTGLGYLFCKSINSDLNYIGLDISNEMLQILRNDFPEVLLLQGTMSDLSMIESDSLDVVISIFTSFSYTDDVEKTIKEIARVLKPNGKIFISALSRYSLRRLLGLKFGKFEHYKSRGTNSKEFSEAWDFTQKNLTIAFSKHEFKKIKIDGYNPFSGFTSLTRRYPKLWGLNLKLAKVFPFLSHELILTAQIIK